MAPLGAPRALITSPVYLNNLAWGPPWPGRLQPHLGQDLRRHWLKARSGGDRPSSPVSRLQSLPPLQDNLAAQKILSAELLSKNGPKYCCPGTGQPGRGAAGLGLAGSARPAPPSLGSSRLPSPRTQQPACHCSLELGPHPRHPKQQLLVPGPCSRGSEHRRRQTQEKAEGLADPGGRRGGGGRSEGWRHLLGSMGGLSPPLSFSALFSEKAPSLGCFSLSTGGEPQA